MPKSIETSCEYDFRDELADSQQPPHSAANKTGGPSKKFRHQNYSKNIYIGTKNAEKWDSIRTSFSFKNDVEFVSYLLKLAEIDLADNNGLHTKPIFSRKSSFDNTKLNDGTETDSESVFQLGPTSKDGSYSSLGHSKSSNVPSIKAKKPKRVQFQDDIPTINSPPPTGLLNRTSGAQNPGLIPNIPLIPASSRLFDSSLEFSRNSLDDSEVLDCRIAEKIKTELSEFHKHRANNEQELNLILNRNGGLLSKIGGNSDNDDEDDEDEDEEGDSDPEGIDNRNDDPNQQKFYDSQTKQDENEVLCLAAMRKEVKPRKPRKKGDKLNSNAEKKTSKQKCNKLDVRRAPLGGKQFSLLQQQLQPGDLDDEDSNPENDIPNEPEYHRNSEESNDSIKVDLKRNCSFCDEAHTSDDCPLRNSTQTITDAIEKSLWIEENRDIVEKYASRLKPETDESEILVNEENEEDDELEEDDDEEEEDDLDSKFMDTNSVTDERIPKEIDNLPTFSDASVPPLFELVQRLDSEMTVVTRKAIPKFTKLGPLIGQIINVKDIPDDCNMRNIYEVYNGVVSFFLSTENKNESNWLRYIRPAPVRDKRNLTLVWLNHENNNLNEIYFVTCQDIEEGCELLFWSDDVNSAWGRKKIDKMNCGGCNIKFDHPLFYRTHCSVFHDPTFSLTIRKYHCKVCGIAVLGKENIMKHAAEMHDGKGAYQCQYCKKYFLRLNYLEMHRNYGCSANPHRARPLCDFCGRKFCQPQKLKVHIKRMHSDMADVLRDFQCKLCSKLLGSRAALQRHSKEVHSRNSTVVSCPRCQKLFQNRSNLKIHMLTHSGVRPFKCIENECNAAFTTKQCLQFHYKKVHGYTQDQMPKIERSIAYTFDAYSGGMKIDFINEQMPRRRRKSSEDPKGDLSSLVMDRPKKAKKNSSSSNDMDKFKSSLGDLCKNESNLSLLSSKISSLLNQELKNTKKLKKKTLNSIINNPELNPGCYNNESEQMKFLNTKKDIFSEENLNAFKMKLFQQPITEDGDLDDDGDDDDSKDSILGNQNNNNSQLNMVESFLTNSSAAGNLNMEPQNSLQMIQNQLNEQSHTQMPFHVNPLTSDNSFNINSIVRSKEFVAPSSAALLNSGIGLIQSKGSKKWINDSMNSDQQSSHQNQNSLMSSVNRDFLARLMMNGCNPQAAANAKYNQNLNEEHDDDSSTILDVVDNQNSSNHPSNAANLENQFSNHSSLQGQMGQLPNISSLPHSGAHSNHLSHNLPHLPLHQTTYSSSFYSSNDGQSANHMSSSNNESVPTGPTSGPNPHNTGNSTASLLVEAALNSVSNMIDNNVDENRNESELNSMEVDIDSIPGEQGHNDQIQRSLQSNIQPGISDSQNPSHLSNHEMGSNIPENEGSFNDIHDIESNVKLMKSLNNFQMNNSSGNENLQFPLSQHSSSSSTNGNHNNNMACASNTNNEIIPENDIDVDSASTPRTIDRTDSNGFRNYQTTATPSPRDISPGQDYNQQHSSHMNSGNTSSMGQHQLFSGSPNLHRNSSNNFQQHNIIGSSSPSQPHPAASPPVIPRYGFTLNEICRKREFDQIHQSQLNIQQGLNPDRRDHNLSSDDDSIVIAQNLSVTNTSGNPNSDELLKLKMNPPLDLIYSKYNDQLNPSSDLADLRMKYNVNENSSLDMPEHFQRNVGSGLTNPNNSSANSSGNDQINDIQGLDMSSRISGYPHHNFQLTAAAAAAAGLNRYHHHIYDILSERDQQQNQQQHHLSQADHQLQIQQQEQQMMLSQDDPHQLSNSQNVSNQEQDSTDQTTSVDLSRTASYVVTSPPSIPYASHPHSDMLRMVSLELNGGNSNPSNGGSNMIGTNNHRSFLSAQHNPRMDTMESLHHHHHRLLTTAEQHRLLASNTAAAAEQLTNPPNHRLLVDPAHLIMESNNRNLLSASAAETSRLLADSGVNHRHMVQSRDFGAYHHQVPPNNYHHHHPHHPLVRPSSLTSPGAHHSGPSSNYHPFPTYY